MITNKQNVRQLKAKHFIELVMQETGESFEVVKPDQWRGKNTQGLIVDIRRQMYELSRPGMAAESGDVITWLQRRYSWSFAMAKSYLEKRAADPIRESQPAPVKTVEKITRQDESESQPLDKWQLQAIEIAGEKIREYFSWSWFDLVMYAPKARIEFVHAPDVHNCAHCGKPINWIIEKATYPASLNGHACFKREHRGPLPVIGYSIKRPLSVSSFGMEGSKELEEVYESARLSEDLQKKINWAIANSFDSLLLAAGDLYVEDEKGVVCEKCAWVEHDFQNALTLCEKSAHKRERTEGEKRHLTIELSEDAFIP